MTQQVLAGRYRIEETLGRGGMATVFKGTDLVLGRPVAVKILAPQFAENQDFVARFRREAQAAARLNNPNLVGVYDTGSDNGVNYIVMEYVEGRTLAEFLERGGRLMPERAIELAEAVCRALEYAHAQGVIHRDIKPGNIMVTRRGEVKVMDFGIARVVTTSETIEQTAAVLGTAAYLSPEQAQGQPVDARSDLYSAGIVLYEMLTGRAPFAGDSPVAVAYKHVQETPVSASKLNADVSPELDAVVMRALSKNPANRYQSAREFREDLERVRLGRPVEATPLLPTAAETRVISRGGPETAVLPPDERGGRNWVAWVFGAVLILGVLAAGLYLLAQALLNDEETKQVKVPSVVGFTQEAATSTLENEGFEVVPEPKASDEDPGTVIEQDPPGGELAPEGSKVTIIVAKAPKPVLVPNVVGQSQDVAEQILVEADFEVVVQTAPNEADPGIVFDQNPDGDTDAERGSRVTIFVSEGPETASVPNVICRTLPQARHIIEAQGFEFSFQGEIPLPPDVSCPPGARVVQQDPAPDSPAPVGSPVSVWIAAPDVSPSPSPSDGD
ncbi:MAG: Stk1 family PASTA domain-containing Ser/Thr kinase [Actinomycetota bacterium]